MNLFTAGLVGDEGICRSKARWMMKFDCHVLLIKRASKTAARRTVGFFPNEYADAIVASTVSSGDRSYDSDASLRGRKDASHKQGRGIGGNIKIVGTPEQVVEQLVALKQAGIDGVQLGFFDFLPDFVHFG
ncbi:hypothetical protein [Paraburkholderia sediminicola]|uniref:hypothetical protein n=1 Tax=Paraburkholderia sediminicola TaxID=458836 RepID=UPI0038BBD3C7